MPPFYGRTYVLPCRGGLPSPLIPAAAPIRRISAAFTVGTGASFASTLASAWIVRKVERDRSPLPYAVYRVALAGVVAARLRRRR